MKIIVLLILQRNNPKQADYILLRKFKNKYNCTINCIDFNCMNTLDECPINYINDTFLLGGSDHLCPPLRP